LARERTTRTRVAMRSKAVVGDGAAARRLSISRASARPGLCIDLESAPRHPNRLRVDFLPAESRRSEGRGARAPGPAPRNLKSPLRYRCCHLAAGAPLPPPFPPQRSGGGILGTERKQIPNDFLAPVPRIARMAPLMSSGVPPSRGRGGRGRARRGDSESFMTARNPRG
jgi:hypothetical protein